MSTESPPPDAMPDGSVLNGAAGATTPSATSNAYDDRASEAHADGVTDPDRVVASMCESTVMLRRWRDAADHHLASEGAGHLVHDLPVRADGRSAALESRPWRLDPVPYVVTAAEFDQLRDLVRRRMTALEVVLRDLYGDQSLVRNGIVPAEDLYASSGFRSDAVGTSPRRWLTVYAVDLRRSTDGRWEVVQDLADAPVGMGYALLDRSVTSRIMPDWLARYRVAPIGDMVDTLRRGLAAVSDSPSPRTVVFSGGVDHPSYVEQSYLAVRLGVTCVEGADLVVRQRRLWLRTLDGLEPVDVVYRRLESTGADPLEVGASGTAGVPGLLLAARSGGVASANAHGSGVLDDPMIARHLRAAATALGHGDIGDGVTTAAGERQPILVDDAAGTVTLDDAEVVLRLFAVHDGHDVWVMAGGTGRVLADGDDRRHPTACIAKDVWVLDATPEPTNVTRLPQVDFGRSVPTRAADALHWMNRAAEGAETLARLLRVVIAGFDADRRLVVRDEGARPAEAVSYLMALSGGGETVRGALTLDAAIAAARTELVRRIGSVLTEATTVRDYLSSTTGRVLEDLARCRQRLIDDGPAVDDLDAILADFSALAGLWAESTVRGPAWSIGAMGRNLERVRLTAVLVQRTIADGGIDPFPDPGSPMSWRIETALATAESLVAYRRRYRSDVESAAATRLLVRDESNPRSVAAGLAQLRARSVEMEWPTGVRLCDDASAALRRPLPEALGEVLAIIDTLSAEIVQRWFSAPTDPVRMAPSTVTVTRQGRRS